jgi:hypothetical protein
VAYQLARLTSGVKKYHNGMHVTVSITLSKERRNYRKLAQEHYNLSDEQMKGKHVHHNPPVSEGGRNIPEHLYVYDEDLHDLVHGGNGFSKSASKGGKKGGPIGGRVKNKNIEKCREGGRKGGATTGAKAQKEGIGFFGLPEEERLQHRKKGGNKNVETGQIHEIRTPESTRKGGQTAGKMNSHHITKTLWRCTVCGAVSTAAGLTHIQRAKGIDKANREKVYQTDERV